MRVLIVFLLHFLSVDFCFGQVYSLSANKPRTIINGQSNLIKIIPTSDTLSIKVTVSNGNISVYKSYKSTSSNGRLFSYSDTSYSWYLCKNDKEMESIFIKYFDGDNLIKTDSFLFEVENQFLFYPALLTTIAKPESSNFPFEEKKPISIGSIENLKLKLLEEKAGMQYNILSYNVEIYNDSVLIKELINEGPIMSEENKKIFINHMNYNYKLTKINAELSCGQKLWVVDSWPIKIEWNN